MCRVLLYLIITLIPVSIIAQIDTSDSYSNIETILEESTRDQDDSQIYDSIESLLDNPVPINTASINDLMQIPFLNAATAKAIIIYRNKLGGINSVNQFKNIEGVSNDVLSKVIPFIKFRNDKSSSAFESITGILKNTKFLYRSRMLQDMQTRSGFTNGKYQGTKPKFYNRLIAKSENQFDAAVLTEKDAGEKSLTDFTSFHLRIFNLAFVDNILLGDYIFEFGQGLALWSPYSFSKGSDALSTVIRNGRGTVPFVSSDENQFLRGGSVKLSTGQFSFTPFFSTHNIDASIDTNTNSISALVIDGMHRTSNEILRHKILNEKLIGISTKYTFNETDNISLLLYRSVYDHSFEKSNLLKPGGSQFNYISTAYNFLIKKLLISGEVASNIKAVSAINTIEFLIDKNFSLVLSYRNFSKEYFVVHGNSFGERGNAQNESGFYTGFYWRTSFGSFNFYYDQFKFPITSSSFNFPSNGNEYLVYYTVKPIPKIELRFRYKNETKEFPEVIGSENGLAKRNNQNIRGEIIFKASQYLQLKTRINGVLLSSDQNNLPDENGILFLEDIKYRMFDNLNIYARMVLFRTDSYDSRLYEFENDLIGVITNPVLYGEGMRWYLMSRYKTSLGVNISLKYSELFKPNEKTLSSGNNEIIGDLDNRLSLQFDWTF